MKQETEDARRLLRHLNSPSALTDSQWDRSTLVEERVTAQPGLTRQAALRQILDATLTQLASSNAQYAELLQGRYWEGLTVAEMVNSERPQPQSERRFFQQQNKALEAYAQLLSEQEIRAEFDQGNRHRLRQLPLPTYDVLFGVDMLTEELLKLLADSHRRSIVCIKGIGGIGKTALADHVVRRAILDGAHGGPICWLNAKQEYLTVSGIEGDPTTQIRVETIFDDLGQRLGLEEVLRLPLKQKVDRLAGVLRSQPHLVVIDNLETITDFHKLLPWLKQLAIPTTFLLTSREEMPSLKLGTTVELQELSRQDGMAMIDHIARAKGVSDVDGQALHGAIGGNPLAIVLAVSQMKVLPPNVVLDGLRSGQIDSLYTYIYRRSWSTLDTTSQQLLFSIQRAGDQADWAWLSTVTQLSDRDLLASLQRLTDLSLVQPQRIEAEQRIYSIHRLTSTFLRTEVLGWK